MSPVLILAYDFVFIEPFWFLCNSATEINFFLKNPGKNQAELQ